MEFIFCSFCTIWLYQVYAQAISAVCQIDYPCDILLIQVLEGSEDEIING